MYGQSKWKSAPLDVVERAVGGDAQAVDFLVRAYTPAVRSYFERMSVESTEAEDLTQEVFLRVARGISHFAGRSGFATWLFRIAKNVGIDFLRGRQSSAVLEEALAGSAESAALLSVVSDVDRYEDAEMLRQAIDALPAGFRSPLVLRDVAGLSYREIAEVLGISVSTVRWRIYEARNRVQQWYEATEGGVGHGRGSGDAPTRTERRKRPGVRP